MAQRGQHYQGNGQQRFQHQPAYQQQHHRKRPHSSVSHQNPNTPICRDYNSPLGCFRKHCNFRHVYDGTHVTSVNEPSSPATADLTLATNYQPKIISRFRHTHHTGDAYDLPVEHYMSMDFKGTDHARLRIVPLGSTLYEYDAWFRTSKASLLPLLLSMYNAGLTIEDYAVIAYRNTFNFCCNSDAMWRFRIQRVGDTLLFQPCQPADSRNFEDYNHGAAGYSFEVLSAVNPKDRAPADGTRLSGEALKAATTTFDEHCIINDVQIGKHKVAMAAEIDGECQDLDELFALPHHPTYQDDVQHAFGNGSKPPSTPVSTALTPQRKASNPHPLTELKTRQSGWNAERLHSVYVQSMLGGVEHIVVASLTQSATTPAVRSEVKPYLSLKRLEVKNLMRIDTTTAVTPEFTARKLHLANEMISFVQQHTKPGGVYRLQRVRSNAQVQWELYELERQQYAIVTDDQLADIKRRMQRSAPTQANAAAAST